MEGSVLSILKAEWKVSDTGSAQCWASSYVYFYEVINYFWLKECVAAMFVNGSKQNEQFL
jgi:hypothetical protein